MKLAFSRTAALLTSALLALGCESILGEVELRDPAPGTPCAKRDTCGPGADCRAIDPNDDESPKLCLQECGEKRSAPCRSGSACVPDAKYSLTPAHCLPGVILPTYGPGTACNDDYRDPCQGGTRCVIPPSKRDVGGDPGKVCLEPCDGDSDSSCRTPRSCKYARSGFYCE